MATPKFRFGELLTNPSASRLNPHRDGYFVETTISRGRVNPGLWYRLTDGHGKFWECREVERPAQGEDSP